MVGTIKGVNIMGNEKSYIPEKAHEVMKNFKVKPYSEVSKHLEAASDRTIAQYKKWKSEDSELKQTGGVDK